MGLSDPQLGIALFGVALGSVPALLATGRVLGRVRAASACRLSAPVFAAALPTIALADGVIVLTLALVLLGAASGCLDVAMNTSAVALEADTGRSLMPGLHGAYSAGVLVGALSGGAAARFGMPVASHFAVVSVVLLGLLAAVWRRLPVDVRREERVGEGTASGGDPPRTGAVGGARAVVLLVPLAVCALLLEGVLTDWSAVLAGDDPFRSATVAAAIVAVLSAAMTVSRATAAIVIRAVGERVVVLTAAACLLVVVPLTVLQSSATMLLLGVGVAGLAIGPLFPIVMSVAGATAGDRAGWATARVTAAGYFAYLAGPPLVGFLAGALGLALALALALVGAGAAAVLLLFGGVKLAGGDVLATRSTCTEARGAPVLPARGD